MKVEDLCVGTNFDIKICGGNKPDECPDQRGSCDADGFRPIYWQHLANEGFSPDFKEECYNDHSKCQFGHNPPLKVSHNLYIIHDSMSKWKMFSVQKFHEFRKHGTIRANR